MLDKIVKVENTNKVSFTLTNRIVFRKSAVKYGACLQGIKFVSVLNNAVTTPMFQIKKLFSYSSTKYLSNLKLCLGHALPPTAPVTPTKKQIIAL